MRPLKNFFLVRSSVCTQTPVRIKIPYMRYIVYSPSPISHLLNSLFRSISFHIYTYTHCNSTTLQLSFSLCLPPTLSLSLLYLDLDFWYIHTHAGFTRLIDVYICPLEVADCGNVNPPNNESYTLSLCLQLINHFLFIYNFSPIFRNKRGSNNEGEGGIENESHSRHIRLTVRVLTPRIHD